MQNTQEFIQTINGMTYDQYLDVLNRFGIPAVENTESNEYLAKYCLQAEREGIEPKQIPFYASRKLVELFNNLPYLATKHRNPVVAAVVKTPKVKTPKIVKEKTMQVQTETKAAKATKRAATKAVKATKTKTKKVAKVARVKHTDFAIVARPDRGGYEGWMEGKAIAFRDTIEKVQTYFQKKYGKQGFIVD